MNIISTICEFLAVFFFLNVSLKFVDGCNPSVLFRMPPVPVPVNNTNLTVIKINEKEVISQVLNDTNIEPGFKFEKFDFDCPEPDGLFPEDFDCGVYYRCSNGTSKLEKCAPTFGFDEIKLKCLPRDEVNCEFGPVDESHKCTRGSGQELYETDCSKFYICIGEKAFIEACPEGKIFDKDWKICRQEKKVSCATSTPTFISESQGTKLHRPNDEFWNFMY